MWAFVAYFTNMTVELHSLLNNVRYHQFKQQNTWEKGLQYKHKVAVVTPNAWFQSVASHLKRNHPLWFTAGRLHSITSEVADDIHVHTSVDKGFRATCCVTDCNPQTWQQAAAAVWDIDASSQKSCEVTATARSRLSVWIVRTTVYFQKIRKT